MMTSEFMKRNTAQRTNVGKADRNKLIRFYSLADIGSEFVRRSICLVVFPVVRYCTFVKV